MISDGFKIICNGTSKNVYPAGFCHNMGDSSLCYRFIDTKPVIVKTLEHSDWNEYATEEEQEAVIGIRPLKMKRLG